MADRYQVWIERAAAERPQLAAALADLGELYHRKLWHQLTVQLEQCIERPEFQEDGFLVELYQNFVSGFAHKINLLKLAFLAVAVGKQMSTPEVGRAMNPAFDHIVANAERVSQSHIQLYLRCNVFRPVCAGGRCIHSGCDCQPGSQQAARHAAADPIPAYAAGTVCAGARAPAGRPGLCDASCGIFEGMKP